MPIPTTSGHVEFISRLREYIMVMVQGPNVAES